MKEYYVFSWHHFMKPSPYQRCPSERPKYVLFVSVRFYFNMQACFRFCVVTNVIYHSSLKSYFTFTRATHI